MGYKADLSPPAMFYVFIDHVHFKMIERQFEITLVEIERGRVLQQCLGLLLQDVG
jgi:hypothetical protein